MAGVNFKSVNVIEHERENLRNARQAVVDKAKRKYEKEEKRRLEAAARGEDKWMLQSITDRIQADKKTVEKAKKKQKKEKKKLKKEKKKRKQKKKQKHESSDSSGGSDSENAYKSPKEDVCSIDLKPLQDSDREDQWVEKSSAGQPGQPDPARRVQGPVLQRDSWMEEGGLFDMPTTSRKEIREKQQREKEAKNAEIAKKEESARMKIELNPYWQNGGTGMPEEDPTKRKTNKVQPMIGDGGVSWLKKSMERCKQQAAEEGRSLEEIAAERWGSLKAYEKMLAEAEKKQRAQSRNERSPPRWKRRERSQSPNRNKKRSRSRSPEQRHRNRSRSRSPKYRRPSPSREEQRRERSGQRFMRPGDSERFDRRDNSRSGRTFMKPGESRSDESRSRSFMKPDGARSYDRSDDNRSRTFMRPGDGSDSSSRSDSRKFMRPEESERADSRDQRQFVHPGDSEDSHRSSRDSENRQKSRLDDRHGSDGPRWRKKGYDKPREESPHRTRDEERSRSPRRSRDDGKSSRRARSESSSSSDSSSSSSESEPEVASSSEGETTPAVMILSEQEMNELGAKILRAEIMGNNAVAEELKAKLDAARKLRDENPSLAASSEKRNKNDPEEVVLTRTTRGGLVQPLPEQQYEGANRGNRRRKQKKIATHGASGDRDRYFDDDDKHSLKSLVQREKMGTAEDQNAMFARLAGRSMEKTDEDYQMDDVIISKAARQQSEAQNEEKDRARAIMEHRKLSSAMEKCRFCFDKVPKHLIIAIGVKVYLCLPNHRSLTPGHCLIVPMQHVTSGTTVDEDVWQEVQTFRKSLVRMFESRDEDVVFMETSMHIKHMPHMCIECIPMERETGDLAPIYFKKAIQDAGPEWSQNKKLVDLSKKDVRHSVPKGFPYFSVDFGLQGGFAHVIEDEQLFPSYFGREIVGGMVDAEPGLWRKPHKESFDVQRKKVLEFAEWWKPFDWTQDLQAKD